MRSERLSHNLFKAARSSENLFERDEGQKLQKINKASHAFLRKPLRFYHFSGYLSFNVLLLAHTGWYLFGEYLQLRFEGQIFYISYLLQIAVQEIKRALKMNFIEKMISTRSPHIPSAASSNLE